MKHTSRVLAFALTLCTASAAFAASMTMLQFGSFETRAEAEKRLAEVTAKHSAFISKLPTNIREIKLPPDNLTVYRTQAGPVESRAAAQSICSQLASSGDECYIVQTAMTAPNTSPAADAAKAADAKVTGTAATAETPVNAKDETATVVQPTPDLTKNLSSLRESPERDPLNRAVLSSVSAGDTTLAAGAASAAAVDAVAPDAAEVDKALDNAIEAQPKVEENLSSVNKENTPPKRGFWSRLNPFSSSEPAKPAAVKTPEATAAPVVDVASQSLAAPEPVVAKVAESEALEAPVVASAAPQVPSTVAAEVNALPAPPVTVSKAPITLDTRPVITQAEPLVLPPPPAPLKAQDRELLAAAKPVVPKPEPIAASALPAPMPVTAGNGSVQVEEAKRVPVTQANAAPAPMVSQRVPVVQPVPAVPLSPSATEGQKAVWAQIGPFASSNDALAYWASYRQNHPDFPVVRVRVATPFQNLAQASPQSWLRVGPVAQPAFVSNLCASLVPTPNLRCGMMRDLGTSSPLARTPGQLPTSRYTR